MSFHYPINGGGGGGGVTDLNGLTGAVTLSAGNNITLNESGNDIEVTANFTQEGKYMISGGITWSGTGLTYDVSFLNYFFNGNKTANPIQVTLAASDPTNNRFDAIVVDEAGTITTITGTPSANPEVPAIPEDQLQVTIILVAAGSTTPTITSEEIYMDDPTTNWTFSTYTTGAATGSINFAGTNTPKQGTECIEASTDARLGARFVRGTSFDAFQYTMLQVWVRFTGTAVATNKSLNVRFENSAGTLVANTVNLFNYGLQRGVLGTWQLVVVPITAFGALPATVKGLKMIMAGGTVGVVRQWDVDFMILTNGSVPYANVPTIAFYKDDIGIASQSGINLIEGTGVTIDAVNNPLYNRVDYTINSSGGGTPAGSDTQIQYNNAGAFGASSDLTFDPATSTFKAVTDNPLFRSTIKFSSNGGTDDLTASLATAFTGTPPTTFIVLAYGNIQIVDYINLVGGNFSQGDTITGSVSGAEGYVAYDDGVGQFYVSITNSIQFAATDVIDNANGVTADYDTSTTSDDIFFWLSTNGGSGGPIVITGTAQTLNDGIDITFGSTTGHGAGDSWEWSYKTLKNTWLTNNQAEGAVSGYVNGSVYDNGSNNIVAINGLVQNGGDDRIFPLSFYQDLSSGNRNERERAYYGLDIFKGDPANPLEFVVKTQKGIGIGPGPTEISTLTVGTLSGFEFTSDKSFQVSTPLFVTQGSLFSWTGDTNSTGITIDDGAQTINFNGEYSFPFADGTSGQTLVTDGAGTLSWASAGAVWNAITGTQSDVNVSGFTNDSGYLSSISGLNISQLTNDSGYVTSSSLSGYTPNTRTLTINGTGYDLSADRSWTIPASPITIGTAGNTLYSSGLSGTGQGDTSAGQNIILGVSAGASASGAYNVNFLGQNAGNAATDASNSNFLGLDAGRNASSANDSNFLGFRAGYGATSAQRSNFLGYNSGNGASGAYQSNFFGYEAGLTASSAGTSNFIGYLAGRLATNAANSNFIGNGAGNGATNAANSIFIGKFAGSSDTVSITGASTDSAILIGSSTSTGGFKNSIAIGNGATNTAANQFLVSAPTQQFTSMTFITTSAGFFKRDAGVVDSRVTTVAYGSTTNLTAGHYDIQVTTSTGATTINLPTGTTSPIGTTYIIKDLDAIAVTSNITIDAGSGNTINAATIAQTYVIAISGECVKLKKVTSTAWAIE